MRYRLCALAALLIAGPGLAQDPLADPEVTREVLESGIAVAEVAAELDDEARATVLELYRQALEQLEAALANQVAAEQYQSALDTAPVEAAAIRAATLEQQAADPLVALDIQASDSAEELDGQLQTEIADLAAAETLLGELNTALETEAQRPVLARERATEARRLIQEIDVQRDVSLNLNESRLATEARRWSADLRTSALETEIGALEQELLSQRARLDLLNARKDATELSVLHARLRVDGFAEAVADRRSSEADEALERTLAVLQDTTASHPLIQEVAEENVALVDQFQTQVSALTSIAQRNRDTQFLSIRLSAAFRSATRKLGLEYFGAPLGQAVREEREQFPDAEEFESARRQVQEQLAVVSLRLIEDDDRIRALGNAQTYVDGELERLEAPDLSVGEQDQLEALLDARLSLLEQSVTSDAAYQQSLYAVDDMLIQVGDTLVAYDALLTEQLFRVRSTLAVSLSDFAALPGELAIQFSPTSWVATVTSLFEGLYRAPHLTLLLIGGFLILFRTGQLRRVLQKTSRSVGVVQADNIKDTVKAFGLTAVLAARWPLLSITLGWLLLAANEPTEFVESVAAALINMAGALFLFTSYLEVFAADGPAGTHFRWDRDALNQFHSQMSWFIAVFVPMFFLADIWLVLVPGTMGGALGFLELCGVLLLMAWLFSVVLNPKRGPLKRLFRARSRGLFGRGRYIWIPLVVLSPVVLVVIVALGFRYGAVEILQRLVDTLWLVLGVMIIAGFAERWLVIARRRLMHEAAVREREAAAKARAEQDETEIMEDPELDELGAETDLVGLDKGSRKLLGAALSVFAVVGFLLIWSDLLPALAVLDSWSFWSSPVVIDGIVQSVPVTLRDVLLALVIGILGYVAARDFPALLEIILLRYEEGISTGGRYAITTLSRYVIVTVVVLVVLGRLGASWSQMGWAVAALSVGIGFGLQEIVANFISGLILLFERPIRLGDVITIGDASGTVTRIRFRATTVRDFDRKELVVPNKEFITGRLLNWTLSDPVTRIVVPVGVAYGSDVETAMKLMREAAEENERVLDDPNPFVIFEQFADSSLSLTLRAWVGSFTARLVAKTELHQAINEKFNTAGIVIAFPQQDVHVYRHSPYEDTPPDAEGPVGA